MSLFLRSTQTFELHNIPLNSLLASIILTKWLAKLGFLPQRAIGNGVDALLDILRT